MTAASAIGNSLPLITPSASLWTNNITTTSSPSSESSSSSSSSAAVTKITGCLTNDLTKSLTNDSMANTSLFTNEIQNALKNDEVKNLPNIDNILQQQRLQSIIQLQQQQHQQLLTSQLSSTSSNLLSSATSLAAASTSSLTRQQSNVKYSNDYSDSFKLPENVLQIRMLVNSKEIAHCLSDNGDFFKQAKVNLAISEGGANDQILSISGSIENIKTAFHHIVSKLDEKSEYASQLHSSNKSDKSFEDPINEYSSECKRPNIAKDNDGKDEFEQITLPIAITLIVPASQCGSIIGKGGAKIREIREITGASIQVSGEMLPQSTERRVTISGKVPVIAHCFSIILNIMNDSPAKGTTIPFRPTQSVIPDNSLRTNFLSGNTATNNPTTNYQQLMNNNNNNNCGNKMLNTHNNNNNNHNNTNTNTSTNSPNGIFNNKLSNNNYNNIFNQNNPMQWNSTLPSLTMPNTYQQLLSLANTSPSNNSYLTADMNNQFNDINLLSSYNLANKSLNANDAINSTLASYLLANNIMIANGQPYQIQGGVSVPVSLSNLPFMQNQQTSINSTADALNRSLLSQTPNSGLANLPNNTNISLSNYLRNNQYPSQCGNMKNVTNQRASSTHPSPTHCYEFVLPNDLIGCIIGRGGQKISEIRQTSGANIKISDLEEGRTERQISITGTAEQVQMAQFLINSRIASEFGLLLA
ncbi:hypothetical protein SNEBB_005517 [Seison nebaliae]|nr:hypothetical protein SNEBB_005517 [Seison nebaliae]